MQYHLSHITDLMQIPAEHWDECINDLRAAMVSLHVVRAAAACDPNAPPLADPKDMCPEIVFEPDGKGEVTPTCGGVPLFSMRITKDEAPNPTDHGAGAQETSDAR